MYEKVLNYINKFVRNSYVLIAAIQSGYYRLQQPILTKLIAAVHNIGNTERSQTSINIFSTKLETVLNILHISNGNTPLGALETMLVMCSPGSRYAYIHESRIDAYQTDNEHSHETALDMVIHILDNHIEQTSQDSNKHPEIADILNKYNELKSADKTQTSTSANTTPNQTLKNQCENSSNKIILQPTDTRARGSNSDRNSTVAVAEIAKSANKNKSASSSGAKYTANRQQINRTTDQRAHYTPNTASANDNQNVAKKNNQPRKS